MREKTIYFPLVFHFHQPVDNFEWVYEDCFKKAYGPLVDSLYNVPEVKVTLHFSGNLLEWFVENKSEFIKKLKEMAKRGQLEIIGGGYYEPIYAIIPKRDRIAQMRKLSDLVKDIFDLELKGAWLSERVWEPNYPSFLNKVGLKYVIIDDNHFRSCGLTQEETLYSYNTEDEGKTLRIFPINEQIRYLTPWKPTYKTIDYLESACDEKGDRIAVLISDAEKMGVWGSTHEFCYEEGKGHQEGDRGKPFIPALLENIKKHSWIKSITLSEYMDLHPARELVYLPTASYDKMEEWVLPTKIRTKFKKVRKTLREDPKKQDEYQFLKGGFWRSFLAKYPESNNMHKKMLHVREKLIIKEDNLKSLEDSKLKSTLQEKINEAWDEIYKSQCNDCYWHGMFGGIYLQFLRFSVYTHLINAEKLIDEINSQINNNSDPYMSITSLDFNKDSKEDIIIESDVLNLYFNPSDGGTLFELDFKPKSYNLLNTLTRWREAYHDDEKLEGEDVKNDRYRRSMLRVRILHDDATLDKLINDNYFEFGDFIDAKFEIIKNQVIDNEALLEMKKTGSIKQYHSEDRFQCQIAKKIEIYENEIHVEIKGSVADSPQNEESFKHLNLVVDFPFFFNGESKKFSWKGVPEELVGEKLEKLESPIEYKGTKFIAKDEIYDLEVQFSFSSNQQEISIYKFPIIAYAYTDTGYREIFQGINISSKIKLANDFNLKCKIKIV